MKCVHTFRTGRHKRKADITLLFQYILIFKKVASSAGHSVLPIVTFQSIFKSVLAQRQNPYSGYSKAEPTFSTENFHLAIYGQSFIV